MPICPTCKGIGKVKQTELCPDCFGKGTITDNMMKFIEFYKHKKLLEKEIDQLENTSLIENINEI